MVETETFIPPLGFDHSIFVILPQKESYWSLKSANTKIWPHSIIKTAIKPVCNDFSQNTMIKTQTPYPALHCIIDLNFLCSVSSDFWLESLTCWHAGPCASVEAKLVLHIVLPLLYSLPKNKLKRLKTSANFNGYNAMG